MANSHSMTRQFQHSANVECGKIVRNSPVFEVEFELCHIPIVTVGTCSGALTPNTMEVRHQQVQTSININTLWVYDCPLHHKNNKTVPSIIKTTNSQKITVKQKKTHSSVFLCRRRRCVPCAQISSSACDSCNDCSRTDIAEELLVTSVGK